MQSAASCTTCWQTGSTPSASGSSATPTSFVTDLIPEPFPSGLEPPWACATMSRPALPCPALPCLAALPCRPALPPRPAAPRLGRCPHPAEYRAHCRVSAVPHGLAYRMALHTAWPCIQHGLVARHLPHARVFRVDAVAPSRALAPALLLLSHAPTAGPRLGTLWTG